MFPLWFQHVRDTAHRLDEIRSAAGQAPA
jgi:hypothetical protein